MQNKMFTVTKIPAKEPVKKLLRVAAYARVSSDKDAAFHSLEQQVDYYGNYVSAHPDWELVQIYSDNAISGTKEDRPAFKQMLLDCRAGKNDLVVTKSITRFARNTVVLLETIRELKDRDIDVYFEKEDMHSMSPDGEFLLTLLAMYAEEEARSASENQKWRVKKKFEQGQPWIGKMLGYRQKDGKFVVIPEEAEVVRKIFQDFLSGKSLGRIAKDLSYSGFSAARSEVWNTSTVRKILANETYTGNLLLQKTYCPDFLLKKRIENRGAIKKYQAVCTHEPIVSIEDFNLVQQKLEANRITRAKQESPGITHLFSGIIYCDNCGSMYRHQYSGSGKYKHPVWICNRLSRLGKDFCSSQIIPETILIEKTKEILGISDLTRDIITEQILRIEVPEPNHMVYVLKDKAPVDVLWHHRSRRESWTPEMKEAARQRTLEHNKQMKIETGKEKI